MGLFSLWDQLVDCICRPPRDVYEETDLVGGTRKAFIIGRRRFVRNDVEIINKRGKKLKCSHHYPHGLPAGTKLPCVVYCHCNSGSRRDSEEAIFTLLPQGISVMALDFEGSGQSEGEWVTLGAHEVDDVECVVNHLRSSGLVTTIGLWGRSMGAVTAMLYAERDPSVAGMVLDSPFSRLTDLMVEIVEKQELHVPRFAKKIVLGMMRRSVRKRAAFDIYTVAPIEYAPRAFIPALFAHAIEDDFVPAHHGKALHDAYGGDKNMVTFAGDHNSPRPPFFYSSVSIFFHNVLGAPEIARSQADAAARAHDDDRLRSAPSATPSDAATAGLTAAPTGEHELRRSFVGDHMRPPEVERRYDDPTSVGYGAVAEQVRHLARDRDMQDLSSIPHGHSERQGAAQAGSEQASVPHAPEPAQERGSAPTAGGGAAGLFGEANGGVDEEAIMLARALEESWKLQAEKQRAAQNGEAGDGGWGEAEAGVTGGADEGVG
ncbi:unnamed protein product [Pedinophyceae sp. YPF-701]|nr:unnamed protein product [Pedinophyceae sp. YPF-701]